MGFISCHQLLIALGSDRQIDRQSETQTQTHTDTHTHQCHEQKLFLRKSEIHLVLKCSFYVQVNVALYLLIISQYYSIAQVSQKLVFLFPLALLMLDYTRSQLQKKTMVYLKITHCNISHTNACTHIHTHRYACTHTHTTCVRMRVCTCIFVCVSVCVCVCAHAHTQHTHTHTTNTHTLTLDTHKHTHTHRVSFPGILHAEIIFKIRPCSQGHLISHPEKWGLVYKTMSLESGHHICMYIYVIQ